MTSNNTQVAPSTAPQIQVAKKNKRLSGETAGNLASQPNIDQIKMELQRVSQSPEFAQLQKEIQAAAPYLENIKKFYSSKDGKLDQAKWATYPLSQIIINANKSPEEKITGIEQRRGQALSDQQKEYIKTMDHKDIFSRTTQEGAQLIRDLMAHGFSKEQAMDVCNNGECGNGNTVFSCLAHWLAGGAMYATLYLNEGELNALDLSNLRGWFVFSKFVAYLLSLDELTTKEGNVSKVMTINIIFVELIHLLMGAFGLIAKKVGPVTDLVALNMVSQFSTSQITALIVLSGFAMGKTIWSSFNASKGLGAY